MSKVEVIESDERGHISHTQGKPPVMTRIRWWLIRKIAGGMPVLLNLEVSPHTKAQCSEPFRVMNCENGMFSGNIIAGNGCGITMRQFDKIVD